MAAIPYVRATHVDGQSWSAAKANLLEAGVNDVSYAPAVRVFNNANISITASGVAQALTFNSERFDQAGNAADTMHDTSTNTGRLTCRYAGVYWVRGNAEFAANATGMRRLGIRLNGAGNDYARYSQGNQGAGNAVPIQVDSLMLLAVNDYVELMATQDSGGALNVLATGNYSPEFMMVRVG